MNDSESGSLIQIQWNDYDTYQSSPTILDRQCGNSLPNRKFLEAPIIRLYGSLPGGYTVLCHLHGVFPYIFVRFDSNQDNSINVPINDCQELHILLELALRKANNTQPNGAPERSEETIQDLRYVANVSLVKGIPFYGFHVGWSAFYKISLLNPNYVVTLSDMLRQGLLFDKKLEVYESHIPYLLQMSTDYNLFGCSWLKLSKCYFRKPILNQFDGFDNLISDGYLESFFNQFLSETENVLQTHDFERVGNCVLEIDVIPQFIRNRDDIEYRNIHHDFVDVLGLGNTTDTKSYVSSTKHLWKDVLHLRKVLKLDTYSTPNDLDRVECATSWSVDAELKRFYERAKNKTGKNNGKLPEFQNFVDTPPWINSLVTTAAAIPELWPCIPISFDYKQNEFQTATQIVSCTDEDLSDLDILLLDEIDYTDIPIDLIDNQTEKMPQKNTNFDDSQLTKGFVKRRKLQNNKLVPSQSSKNIWQCKPLNNGIQYIYPYYRYKNLPLSYDSIVNDIKDNGLPTIEYQEPYFSNPVDLRNRKRYLNPDTRISITSNHISCKEKFDRVGNFESSKYDLNISSQGLSRWLYIPNVPKYAEVLEITPANLPRASQIEGPSQEKGVPLGSVNIPSENLKSFGDDNLIVHLSLELHILTRNSKLPNPELDPVKIIFWSMNGCSAQRLSSVSKEGIMIFMDENEKRFESLILQACGNVDVAVFESEELLLQAFSDLVLIIDPDILSGYEVNKLSWGYLLARANFAYDIPMDIMISRIAAKGPRERINRWNYDRVAGVKIMGRHMLNIWRKMKSELNISKYSFENAVFHVLRERLPQYSYENLTKFWNDKSEQVNINIVINYWKKRVSYNIRLVEVQQIISKTFEEARLIGIDFYSVMSRGSQFKVESFLARICKSEYFILLSPSKSALKKQKALECVPLIMEPQSSFYKSPLLVLDFQSLYPSVMMAYNYCYSTVIGRVRELTNKNNEIGITKINIPANILHLMDEHITISPNGVLFLRENIRKSVLSKMLKDILSTRILIKETMKALPKEERSLLNSLNNRQLALKFLANVIYGYTSASYSGRMPCSDIADSIVQTGRETLRKAIEMIESEYAWGAKVVYGDTDSLFVYLPGKSLEQAFEIGNSIARAVTAANPSPVKLQFEKVYHPCILVSKKRYVGYSYQDLSQKVPKFDAKGIETIRRDGCPAQQKIVQKSLEILFLEKDLSKVKSYVMDQFRKITLGNVSIQDFCFAREVRIGTYKNEYVLPPAARVAEDNMLKDIMAKPEYRERVSYVVVKGKQGERLLDRCISPDEFMASPNLELDADYYITKTLLPPLERFFNLVSMDIRQCYRELPRYLRFNPVTGISNNSLQRSMKVSTCLNCRNRVLFNSKIKLCEECIRNPSKIVGNLLYENLSIESKFRSIVAACKVCSDSMTKLANDTTKKAIRTCESLDCPIYYSRNKSQRLLTGSLWNDIHRTLKRLDSW
ncbi:DNA-directed DNA polymerase Ecym_2378 [Eremothecium cymbalariae DBVPG|uniref:DNA polymerase n=1 Tax=Eremothecium cymbalariae (strain CBS 270.75 / DBVPG 7215 / KCTC 17166 / NRRL Y-17582) TaxID=931890 RepID=G8JNP3_ERECY|nr:Hypothetical protein Ecym_2378 [Eremothecium cymbalariae DBVPG\